MLPYWLPPLLAAPFAGSTLGVVIRRLPRGETVALDRSRCETCRRALGVRDLVPVASFVALRGRCRHCGAAIAPAHLAIELAATGVGAWAILATANPARLWLSCLLGWTLLALAWIDWEHMRLPDALTLPLLLLGLAATSLLDRPAMADHAAAAALGYLALRSLALGYKRLRGREGLGGGDAKLLAAAGSWVGLQALPTIVFEAALFGLILALAERWRGRALSAATALPFGPGLCAALWLTWLYGLIL